MLKYFDGADPGKTRGRRVGARIGEAEVKVK